MRRNDCSTIDSAFSMPRRAQCVSRNSSDIVCGNFGAPPNPPYSSSYARLMKRYASSSSDAESGSPATGCVAYVDISQRVDRRRDFGGLRAIRLRDGGEDARERRHAVPILARIVRAAVKRHAVGRQKHRHRPAAVTRHRLHGLHVDRVEVGPLLAIHLDVHEALVHQRRRRVVLERLVRHHVAPVARRVADAQQDRLVFGLRALERLGRPRIPVDRIVGVLQQVGTCFRRQTVGHCEKRLGSSVLRHDARPRS